MSIKRHQSKRIRHNGHENKPVRSRAASQVQLLLDIWTHRMVFPSHLHTYRERGRVAEAEMPRASLEGLSASEQPCAFTRARACSRGPLNGLSHPPTLPQIFLRRSLVSLPFSRRTAAESDGFDLPGRRGVCSHASFFPWLAKAPSMGRVT